MFSSNKTIFIDRLAKECILSDNNFIRLYNFFIVNNYKIVNSIEKADIVILDLCGLSKSFLDETSKKIENYLSFKKDIILTGCISGVFKSKFGDKLIYLGSKNYQEVENYFEFKVPYSKLDDYSLLDIYNGKIKGLQQQEIGDLKNSFGLSLNDTKTSFVEISTGCSLNCSYCNIRKIKGKTDSHSIEELVNIIKKERSFGKNHFYLLSDDCGSYGLDIKKTLPDLLDEIFAIDDEIKISITNFYPGFFLKYYDRIKKYIYENRIIFILLPLQHTSQRILKMMNRPYDTKKLEEIIKDMKTKSNTGICNHIIFDWPTETLEEFIDTFRFLNLYDRTYYNKYSDVNNIYKGESKNYDFKEKLILLKRLQRKYYIDIAI